MRVIPDLERRLYAFTVDHLLLWSWYAVAAGAAWAAWGAERLWLIVAIVLGLAVVATLAAGVVLGLTGATLGHRLLGLRVVHHQTGTPIGVGAGVLRSTILGLATLPTVGFGLAALAWTALVDASGLRRGWHDQLAGSLVIDVRPVPEPVEELQEAPRQVVNLTAMRLMPTPVQPASQVPRPAVPRPPAPAPVQPPAPAWVAPPAPATAPVPVQPPMPEQPQRPAWTPAPNDVEESGRTVVRPQPGADGSPVPAPAAGGWRVAFDTGESFVIEGTVLVGRRPEPRPGERVRHVVPLPSADMSLSKTHAQFGPAPDGTLVVMDRGSTNGSLLVRHGVTRELVPGRPTTLVTGDRVRFGDREMTVHRQE